MTTSKDYLYRLLSDIANVGGYPGNNISKEEFLEKYKGTAQKENMEKIFSVFEKLDTSNDGIIDFSAVRHDGLMKWKTYMSDMFFKLDPSSSVYDPDFIFNMPDNIEGMKISKDNFKEALETLYKLVQKKNNELREAQEKESLEELKSNNSNIPENVLDNIRPYIVDTNIPIKIIDAGYEIVSQEESLKFNSEGKLTTLITNYNEGTPGEFGIINSLTSLYDEEGNCIENTEKYKGGYTCTCNRTNKFRFLKYGKNQLSYMPHLTKITVNTGLPNETTFAVSMDNEGHITDISDAESNQILKMSDKTKSQLITLLNNSAILGLTFDLNVSCNEVFVEIIKDENLPEKAKSEIDRLIYAGMREGDDYKTELLENGDCSIEYLKNKSRDFRSDKKKTIYHSDGTEVTFEKKGEQIYIRQNGETQEYSVEEFKKIMPEEQSFVQEKEFLDEPLQRFQLFKIEDSKLANKLYKLSERKYISDTEYSQDVGKNTYNVKIEDDKISVKRNGEEVFVDVSGMTAGEQKLIAECNPEVLFRIASKGIKLILSDPPSGTDGEYLPEQNVIYIAPEASEISILQRRIAHETGHSYYTHLNEVNEELEESFKKESEQYLREAETIIASIPPEGNELDIMIKRNEVLLKKFDKYVPESYDERYCAENVYEFVAEAYCLLVTGNTKSEFTIANVYPKTFAIVKKMIEKSN